MIASIELPYSEHFDILHRQIFDLITLIFLWQGYRIQFYQTYAPIRSILVKKEATLKDFALIQILLN